MIIDIKNIYGNSLFVTEAIDLRDAVEKAVKSGARLDGASLDGARLDGARLDGASLVRARLVGASLDGARLDGARLDGASLVRARLVGASLDGARLDGARLDGASLDGASLPDAMKEVREDIHAILDHTPNEVPGLVLALIEGRVNGSLYEGECACLLGTLANVRGCDYRQLGVAPFASRPAEVWFTRLVPGLTPDNSADCALTLAWVREWQWQAKKELATSHK